MTRVLGLERPSHLAGQVVVHFDHHCANVVALLRASPLVRNHTHEQRRQLAHVERMPGGVVRVDYNAREGHAQTYLHHLRHLQHLHLRHVALEVVVELVIRTVPLQVRQQVLVAQEGVGGVASRVAPGCLFAEDVAAIATEPVGISLLKTHCLLIINTQSSSSILPVYFLKTVGSLELLLSLSPIFLCVT